MTLQVRDVAPAEHERVGELTVGAYAALPVDHLWGGYDVEIRAVAERLERADVRACVERAREQGMQILLHTTDHMPTAQRLYPRLGFVRRPERDVHEFEEDHHMTFLAFTLDPSVSVR